MIGTALMILVMGGHQTEPNPSNTPWNINILDNNKVSIFGISLEKTTIQDANQIFASFPETRLIEQNNQLQLRAIYHELQFSGLVANIELIYKLDDSTLQSLKDTAIPGPDDRYFHLVENKEISLLNSTVSSLIYKPAIDYEIDIILQRFGPPQRKLKLSENVSRWTYIESGLDIIIDNAGPDVFIYSSLENEPSASEMNKEETTIE